MTVSRCIHVVANGFIPFFLMTEYPTVYVYHIFFILSFVDWHHKTPRKEHRQNIHRHKLYQSFSRSVSQGNKNKNTNKQMGPNQTYTLFQNSVSRSVVSDSLQLHGLQPLSMKFSSQEYWSGLPFASPGDLSGAEKP